MTDIIITVQDAHQAGFCNKGARKYFKRQGLNWHKFVMEGLPLSAFDPADERIQAAYKNALRRTTSEVD